MDLEAIVYVNGCYVTRSEAVISVFDRGFLFSDGVYEVCSVIRGALVDNAAHLARLDRSLKALKLASPVTPDEMFRIQKELVIRNHLREGIIYIQITRGAADRDFEFPKGAKSNIVAFVQHKNVLDNPAAKKGVRIVSVDDIRWRRRDIKTTGLLARVLAKEEAKMGGGEDAWMVENGYVTEGSSNNAFIVSSNQRIITRNLGAEILPGITRRAVLDLADREGISIEERPFSLEEAYCATEAFITSASLFVMPVISIDGRKIGDGRVGEITKKLRNRYIQFAEETAEAILSD